MKNKIKEIIESGNIKLAIQLCDGQDMDIVDLLMEVAEFKEDDRTGSLKNYEVGNYTFRISEENDRGYWYMKGHMSDVYYPINEIFQDFINVINER